MTNHRPLTPADVQSLRQSLRWRGTVGDHAHTAQIVYLPADGHFALINDNRLMATSADLATLGACLIAERAESGFIRRILDPATDCETACLDPKARADTIAQRRADAARVRLLNEAAEADARRRRFQIDVTKLDLEDL